MKPNDFLVREEAEALFDITLVAGDLIRSNKLREDIDSRDLFADCVSYAQAFCSYAPKEDWDYLTIIDEFATSRLLRDYGKENDHG